MTLPALRPALSANDADRLRKYLSPVPSIGRTSRARCAHISSGAPRKLLEMKTGELRGGSGCGRRVPGTDFDRGNLRLVEDSKSLSKRSPGLGVARRAIGTGNGLKESCGRL